MKNFKKTSQLADEINSAILELGKEFYAITLNSNNLSLQGKYHSRIAAYAKSEGYTTSLDANGYVWLTKTFDDITVTITLTE